MSFRVAYSPVYVHPVPENHRFPMEKYELLYQQLIRENIVPEENFFVPESVDTEFVLAVHNGKYLQKLTELSCTPREQRVSGFVHSDLLIQRELTIMEGTRKCAGYAIEDGISMNIAGGTHHAYSDRGEGFCLLNDQAIAAQWLLDSAQSTQILIIDLDVHQGNGTAEIFRDNKQVFTFSMHGENNYPLKKEQSDLDVPLNEGTTDEEYLDKLGTSLKTISETFTPDFIFYQCGVDVLQSDKLGKLSLSLEGCKKRDEVVFKFAAGRKAPVVCSMGGGYGLDLRSIVNAHVNTFKVAADLFG